MSFPAEWIVPDWPAPLHVRSLVTTRHGGVSDAPYAGLNLGSHVGDDPAHVACNRALLRARLPDEPVWLDQVHGTRVVRATASARGARADASFAIDRDVVCAVLTADCLPVLLCDDAGSVVAAVHAGWRGLVDGVIERAVAEMGGPPQRLLAWLGPAIGPGAFEVGGEVRQRFMDVDRNDALAFEPGEREGKWMADLYRLARARLARAGVDRVYSDGQCTVTDAVRFYSFRRDGVTGRFASLIWLAGEGA